MATSAFLSTSSCPTLLNVPKIRNSTSQLGSLSSIGSGLKLIPNIQITKASRKLSPVTRFTKTKISCSAAQPETLKNVQSIIAKQLSIEESTVTPETKFADLGADSLDIVEIMMALEETFGVSVGEGGAENIATVQDAADLIEKVKAAA